MAEIKKISFSYLEYDRIEDLDMQYLKLIEEAKKASENAYAPYSGFRVGAAVLLESGRIILGSNVENAAFPSGICAERTALSYSISNFPGDRPSAIAIAAMNANKFTFSPVSPCGNCRQMIIEEELRNNKEIKILLYGENSILVIENAASLLPLQFNKESLKY
ncbi:MAG: cytidine deaminase [Bacteroidales bacterium]|nr:cytidine deaminase [Bacteroidales bacterium]